MKVLCVCVCVWAVDVIHLLLYKFHGPNCFDETLESPMCVCVCVLCGHTGVL